MILEHLAPVSLSQWSRGKLDSPHSIGTREQLCRFGKMLKMLELCHV